MTARRVLLVLLALPDLLAHRVLLARWGLLVLPVPRARRVRRALRDLRVHRVPLV